MCVDWATVRAAVVNMRWTSCCATEWFCVVPMLALCSSKKQPTNIVLLFFCHQRCHAPRNRWALWAGSLPLAETSGSSHFSNIQSLIIRLSRLNSSIRFSLFCKSARLSTQCCACCLKQGLLLAIPVFNFWKLIGLC